MSQRKNNNEKLQSVIGGFSAGLSKVVPGACLTVLLVAAVCGSSAALAESSKHQDRIGHFALSDGSMLGRYGDVNDEWVQRSSVGVSNEAMTSERKHSKKDNRLGAFSVEDGAMLGRYGDKDDGY